MKLFTTVILLFAFGITMSAQTLKYPEKNCDGASVKPEGLHSWCHDSQDDFYDECECRFEKAMEAYESEKKRLEDRISSLYSEQDQLSTQSDQQRGVGHQYWNKLSEEDNPNFQSDKQKALSALLSAKASLQQAIKIEKEIYSLQERKGAFSVNKSGLIPMQQDLEHLESTINSVKNAEPRKTLSISNSDTSGSTFNNGNQDSQEENMVSGNYDEETQERYNRTAKEEAEEERQRQIEAERERQIEVERQRQREVARQERIKQEKMNEAAIAGAYAMNTILDANGPNVVDYWTLMGGVGWSDNEEVALEYSSYSASILHHGKGKFLAHEFGLKYSDNYYHQAIGVPFGFGFGIGSEDLGILLLGGFEANYMFSYNEEYEKINERLDEEGSSGIGNLNVPLNCSATIYYFGGIDLGLTLKLSYYFSDFAGIEAYNSDELSKAIYPNPYPGMQLTFGLAF